ncbi:DUF1189 domain-containing protein [Bacillus sp. DJP31]|uniref:DUF1189 domain-containing protein n=1 Tax=Bacillus sp. DJP31 TaxID=3409789 RepID=UPI003BB6C5FA
MENQKQKQSFFRKVKNSVIRPKELPNMAKEGIGRAILYLLLLALTLGVLNGTVQSVKAYLAYSVMIENVKEELPGFVFENGELSVEGDEPIILGESEEDPVIIDDTGTYTRDNYEELLEEYRNVTLITNESILTHDGIQTTEFSLSDFGSFYVDKEMLLTFLPFLSWSIVLYGIGIVIWFFVSKLVMGFLYALLGLIAASILKKSYSYGTLYSMGLYAITLPTMVAILLMLINVNLPWLLYAGIVVVYYVFAFRQAPIEESKEEILPL